MVNFKDFKNALLLNFSPTSKMVGALKSKEGKVSGKVFQLSNIEDFIERYRDDNDVYMTFAPLAEPRRLKRNALPTRLLMADIDGADIPEDFKPSFYWETSPKKYQGMWVIDNELSQEEYEHLAQAMTKVYKFDSANDITHLYRLPLTKNHKYATTFDVSNVQGEGTVYRKREVLKKFESVETKSTQTIEHKSIEMKRFDLDALLEKYHCRKAFEADVVDRSSYVFSLAMRMFENGATEEEVKFTLLMSKQDKWTDNSIDGIIASIKAKAILKNPKSLKKLEQKPKFSLVKVNDIEIKEEEVGWLVEGLWAASSVGLIVAPPKSYKSALVTNIASCVAQGKPFDGREVQQGNVMILQGENTLSSEKKRLQLINDGNTDAPIFYVQSNQVNLDNIEILKDAIVENEIKLFVIDPLYMLLGEGDINAQKDMTRKLSSLTRIKNETGCSIILVHHTKKTDKGEKLDVNDIYGSAFINGWYQSLIMLEPTSNPTEMHIQTRFRDFPPAGGKMKIDGTLKATFEGLHENDTKELKEQPKSMDIQYQAEELVINHNKGLNNKTNTFSFNKEKPIVLTSVVDHNNLLSGITLGQDTKRYYLSVLDYGHYEIQKLRDYINNFKVVGLNSASFTTWLIDNNVEPIEFFKDIQQVAKERAPLTFELMMADRLLELEKEAKKISENDNQRHLILSVVNNDDWSNLSSVDDYDSYQEMMNLEGTGKINKQAIEYIFKEQQIIFDFYKRLAELKRGKNNDIKKEEHQG